jgi:hypothetical protein
MKMPNRGFNPAGNVQLATDTSSRAIVGVEVTFAGTDSVGRSAPMRQQVEQRTGKTVQQHLIDGGYLRKDAIENAGEVELFVPPKPAKSAARSGPELEPKRGDSPAVLRWNKRMASPQRKGNLQATSRHPRDRQRRSPNPQRAHTDDHTRDCQDQMRRSVVRTRLQRLPLRSQPAGIASTALKTPSTTHSQHPRSPKHHYPSFFSPNKITNLSPPISTAQ